MTPMQILNDTGDRIPDDVATAVTMGVYDGVHRGHQAVLKQVRSHANQRGLKVAVVTFDIHPAYVLRPENAPKMLTTLEQRLELFEAHGVDYVYLVNFTKERAETPESAFGEEVFAEALNAKIVVVGADFHFGKDRGGNVATLTALGQRVGFDVEGLDLVADEGATEPISSTAIRRALAGGNVTKAAAMLGRLHEVRGEVTTGDQRGRTIGFPTANIAVADRFAVPADGVYAGWCTLESGERHGCAINIGRRPTFHEHATDSLIEAHLLDFAEDIYGQQVRLEFLKFLRSENRFDGVDSLIAQLKQDVTAARGLLGI